MNTTHPADLSPLSYGTGLALGLFLILGLPGEPDSSGGNRQRVWTADPQLAGIHSPPAVTLAVSLATDQPTTAGG